jgi:hypothetical protein
MHSSSSAKEGLATAGFTFIIPMVHYPEMPIGISPIADNTNFVSLLLQNLAYRYSIL